jgi:hypothetical protein
LVGTRIGITEFTGFNHCHLNQESSHTANFQFANVASSKNFNTHLHDAIFFAATSNSLSVQIAERG